MQINPLIKKEVWVLCDKRAGNVSQALGLADQLGYEYRIIDLSYNLLAVLPNIILGPNLYSLDVKSRFKLKNPPYFPVMAIAAGRRAALALLYIKKASQNKTKIIQIMNPEIDHKKFDFIILPRHDSIKNVTPNMLQTIGSLGRINDRAIEFEKERFAQWFADIKKPKIALFVGGNSKNTVFDAKSAFKLAKQMSKIANNMQSKLLVLNSRRTSNKLTKALKSGLSGDFKFFDFHQIKENENPYLAIVGYSDFFVVTGDSVSMISEVCSAGKPIYIFDEKNISNAKHRKFHQDLFAESYAKKLDENAYQLENFSSKKLSETKRIAEIILKNVF